MATKKKLPPLPGCLAKKAEKGEGWVDLVAAPRWQARVNQVGFVRAPAQPVPPPRADEIDEMIRAFGEVVRRLPEDQRP